MLPIDSRLEVGHACHMLYQSRKFVAALLIIWLPLFNGSAMSSSISMQMMSGHCQMMVGTMSDHASATDEQQDGSCTNHGVCHFACSGYMVASTIKVAQLQLPTPVYTNSATQFLSFATAPLDPPPLAHA